MRKTILPSQVVQDYNQKHKDYTDLMRKRLRCKLCFDLWQAQKLGLAKYWQQYRRSLFKGEEQVYKVTFKNGTTAYYHAECMDKMKELCKTENAANYSVCRRLWSILKLDSDGTLYAGSGKLIKKMRENNVKNPEIVIKLMETYNMSRASAYRKISSVS